MVYFKTQNPNLGIFWRALEWKMLVCFITIWNILQPFGKIYGHLVYFPVSVCLGREKHGIPALK
jgi:hypothetical protein